MTYKIIDMERMEGESVGLSIQHLISLSNHAINVY